MKYCVAAPLVAAVMAAVYFIANVLFDHSPLTNVAVLGLLVGVVLAGMASYGAVPVLVVVGFLVFGLSHHLTGYLLSLKIAGWVSAGLVCLVVVVVVVWQAPGFLRSFKPRTRAEYQADLRQIRQDNRTQQERADQARFERERQQLEAERKEKERARHRREGIRQRRHYRTHYDAQKRRQRRLNFLRRLRIIPAGVAVPLDADVEFIPEPTDWSDPNQRVPYQRAVMQAREAEQMRLADLALMSLAQEQRQRQERNARWIERCRRLGLHGLVPPAQSLPTPRAFVAEPDGQKARDEVGRVVEFIEGEGDTFIVIEPDDMKAEAARGGFEWQWTRKPTIVAHPVKKAPHQAPSRQDGGPWL